MGGSSPTPGKKKKEDLPWLSGPVLVQKKRKKRASGREEKRPFTAVKGHLGLCKKTFEFTETKKECVFGEPRGKEAPLRAGRLPIGGLKKVRMGKGGKGKPATEKNASAEKKKEGKSPA